jgi:hypothetical protein
VSRWLFFSLAAIYERGAELGSLKVWRILEDGLVPRDNDHFQFLLPSRFNDLNMEEFSVNKG